MAPKAEKKPAKKVAKKVAGGKGKKGKSKVESFKIYIYKVLKQVRLQSIGSVSLFAESCYRESVVIFENPACVVFSMSSRPLSSSQIYNRHLTCPQALLQVHPDTGISSRAISILSACQACRF